MKQTPRMHKEKGETAQETDLRVDLRQVLPVECNSWGSDKGARDNVGHFGISLVLRREEYRYNIEMLSVW